MLTCLVPVLFTLKLKKNNSGAKKVNLRMTQMLTLLAGTHVRSLFQLFQVAKFKVKRRFKET